MLYTKKEEAVAAVNAFTEDKVHVISDKDYHELLSNFKLTEVETEVDKRIGQRIKEVYDQLDEDLFNVTGVRKGDDEKTYTAIKRVLSDLKTKAEKVGGDESEELKALRKDFAKKMEAKDLELANLSKLSSKKEIVSALNIAKAKLTFKKSIPEAIREKYSKDIINDLAEKAQRDSEGKIRWKDQNGVDITDNYKLVTDAQKVLELALKDVIGEDAGGGGNDGGGGEPAKLEKAEAIDLIKQEGLAVGTPAFTKRFRELTGEASKKE